MKIRNGFVSNSSSSSFVVCIPDDLDIAVVANKFIELNGTCEDELAEMNVIVSDIQQMFSDILDDEGYSDEEKPSTWEAIFAEFEFDQDTVIEAMGGVVIAQFDVSSDNGATTIYKKSELLKVIERVK